MKSVVVWLWNDPETAEPEPRVVLPGPPQPPAPKPVPNVRLDMQPKLSWRERQIWRAQHGYGQRPKRRPQQAFHERAPRPARIFTPAHVNIAQKMVARHLKEPHRFICVADSKEGLAPEVEFLQTPPAAAAVAHLRSPEGNRFPSCYRRLWSFSDDARVLGERIMVIDIDFVATADISSLFKMTADFVGWVPERAWGQQHRFGGGQYLLTPGTRTAVWTKFNAGAIATARAAGFRGSDQAWMSYTLRDKETYWPRNSGIHSVRELGPGFELPSGARIVHFNGHRKPWHYKSGWVAQHWR